MLQSFSHDYPRPFPFDHWTAEAMLTIDYGSPEAGSAYHRHQRIEGRDIYSRIGRHDLTADVNFADLMSWGGSAVLGNGESGDTARIFRAEWRRDGSRGG